MLRLGPQVMGKTIFWFEPAPCLGRFHTAQAVAFRFASEEFQLCLPPLQVLSGKWRKAERPLQRVSRPAREARFLSRVRPRFVPVVGGSLQTGPMPKLHLLFYIQIQVLLGIF